MLKTRTRHRGTKTWVASLLAVMLAWSGALTSLHASAGVVTTGEMLHAQQVEQDRAAMKRALDRSDVRERLMELGVSPAEVDNRIDALTADELAQLQQEMDDMPAGAGAVGLLAVVVLIFFVTDVLGITDVFPFINAAK